MTKLSTFSANQIRTVNDSTAMAEELVSNHFKMSASEWLRPKYDVKTMADLAPEEIVEGPFAQIIRYKGQRHDSSLSSAAYDFYKICLQDHAILDVLRHSEEMKLAPFSLYIITHELIHIVRFSRFLQNFDATNAEKLSEETRVHHQTHEIIDNIQMPGLQTVLNFYARWRLPFEELRNP